MTKTLPSHAGSAGSTPGQGTKILQGLRPKNQNIKQKQHCNKFNKDFKNGSQKKKKTLKKQILLHITLLSNSKDSLFLQSNFLA